MTEAVSALRDLLTSLTARHCTARFLMSSLLDAGYTAHPCNMFKEQVVGIRGPLSIKAPGKHFADSQDLVYVLIE